MTKTSLEKIKSIINKKVGHDVAYNLTKDESPATVKDWISTGSFLLDCTIARGIKAGIPVGRITEIASLSGVGKSYLAAQIAVNAQKKGYHVVYFDSERAIDSEFLINAGCDLDHLTYILPDDIRQMFEIMEAVLSEEEMGRVVFILDSLAMLPDLTDVEGDFNPSSSVSVKARTISKGISKLLGPLNRAGATWVILNHLKTNISPEASSKYATDEVKYFTPGGLSVAYACHLRIWLVKPHAKASFVEDEKGFIIGSTVKAKLIKSRYGTEKRKCEFKILWGDPNRVGVCDDESLFEVVKISPRYRTGGPWKFLMGDDKQEVKFQEKDWSDLLKNDANFFALVMKVVEEEMVVNFNEKKNAADFYFDKETDEGHKEIPNFPDQPTEKLNEKKGSSVVSFGEKDEE